MCVCIRVYAHVCVHFFTETHNNIRGVDEAPGIPRSLSNVASNLILSEGNRCIFVHFSKATMKLIIDSTVSPKLIANQIFGVQRS